MGPPILLFSIREEEGSETHVATIQHLKDDLHQRCEKAGMHSNIDAVDVVIYFFIKIHIFTHRIADLLH